MKIGWEKIDLHRRLPPGMNLNVVGGKGFVRIPQARLAGNVGNPDRLCDIAADNRRARHIEQAFRAHICVCDAVVRRDDECGHRHRQENISQAGNVEPMRRRGRHGRLSQAAARLSQGA